MIMPIANYPFDGPHRSVEKIENRPGVFAVICEFEDKYYLLDVDYSDDIKQAILNHGRRRCWEKYRKGHIRYAVLYERNLSFEDKEDVERKIRHTYRNIPCGTKNSDTKK